MTDEAEIFKEWCETYFDEPLTPLEYIYYRESLDFQRYLFWYRAKELIQTIKSSFRKLW